MFLDRFWCLDADGRAWVGADCARTRRAPQKICVNLGSPYSKHGGYSQQKNPKYGYNFDYYSFCCQFYFYFSFFIPPHPVYFAEIFIYYLLIYILNFLPSPFTLLFPPSSYILLIINYLSLTYCNN